MKRTINWLSLVAIFSVTAGCVCMATGAYNAALALYFDAPWINFWRGAFNLAIGAWCYNRGMELDRRAYRLALAEWELKRNTDEIKSHPDYRFKE